MKDQTFEKTKLVERIKQNRMAHQDTFASGIEGYGGEVQRQAAAIIKRVKAGDNNVHGALWDMAQLPRPEDHTSDYDAVIDMLELSSDTEIVLTYADFVRYVRDDWPWKGAFTASVSNYSST